MISIAVCDDDEKSAEWIEKETVSCLEQQKIMFKWHTFTNSKALLYEVEDGSHFDLLLLDIDMPKLGGMELTERIKEILPEVLIIFVTSYEKYVYEAFKVQPFRFIPKKYLEQFLDAAMQDAVQLIERNANKFYVAENQKGMEKILLQRITHIWHMEKYAYIEKTNGEYTKVRKTLSQIEEELPKSDFVRVDRGCICNLSQIERIANGDILFTNGVKIAVSKERVMDLKNRLRVYWLSQEEKM